MTESLVPIAGTVFATTVLLAFGASVGFWAGVQSAARAYVGRVEPTSTQVERSEWAIAQSRCIECSRRSSEQCEEVAMLAESCATMLPDELLAAIERMVQTTRELAKELRQLEPSTGSLASARVNQPHRNHPPTLSTRRPLHIMADTPNEDLTLSTEEMSDVMGGRHRLVETPMDTESKCYPYDCVQRLAPWLEDDLFPDSNSFVKVRCHDVSVSGISFFWPDAPVFTRAVISIGPVGKEAQMVIEICSHKAVFMHKEVCFLVGSRFVSRLEADCEHEVVCA